MLPESASFLVTENCNLACKYCFEKPLRNDKIMTKETARKALEYLCENSIKNGSKNFHAMLFGGEPLLNLEVIEEIFKYALELEKKTGSRFSASIVTNATILNDEVKRILSTYMKSARISVQLSVDGIKESHDMYRVDRAGKGTFDRIEKNIPGWKELFKDNMNSLSLHGCLNKKTLKYLYESYIFFREKWDIPRIWFMPIHSEKWEDSDVDLYESELNKIADYILKRAKDEKIIVEVQNYAPIDRCLNRDVRPSAPCGAGKTYVTITAKGDIYPCHHFYFNDPEQYTKIGDIWNGVDEQKRKMYMEYDNKDMSCAKENPNCDAYHCYRCIADNWVAKGNFLSQITGPRCEMSKIERKIHIKMREELKKMGLLNKNNSASGDGNNPNNPACLCDLGGSGDNCEGCDIVTQSSACKCNLGGPISDCDVVNGIDSKTGKPYISELEKESFSLNKKECSCGSKTSENEELYALALKTIIEKLEEMEKVQNLILRKVL